MLGTDAVLTVTVSGKAMYVANFEKESIVAGTFGIKNRATSNYIRALDRCTFKTTASHPFITYFNIGLDEAKELNALSFYVNGVSTNVNVFTQLIDILKPLFAFIVLIHGKDDTSLVERSPCTVMSKLAILPRKQYATSHSHIRFFKQRRTCRVTSHDRYIATESVERTTEADITSRTIQVASGEISSIKLILSKRRGTSSNCKNC